MIFLSIVLGLAAAHPAASAAPSSDPYSEVNENWDQFGSVYNHILANYYEELDHSELMRSAIDGLLGELDSYSQFFDAAALRELRQDTTGKFAGLGITVGIKDGYPVVISPIEGTPAYRVGMLPGDLIVAIEGSDTHGMPLSDIVDRLRGEPGSTVTVTLHRTGVRTDWDVAIERDVIKIHSVAVAELIASGVGYLSMRQTRFSEDTSAEVEAAIRDLMARGATRIILDLRGNPGGLLSQATQVADLFLPQGAPIVALGEGDRADLETRHSQRRPIARGLPLAVLVDKGSASASEIVAGAIQDNDRGVVIGTASFGKGSVQTIFDLQDREQSALKLTTALYYTPSGRSIHRRDRRWLKGLPSMIPVGEVELPSGAMFNLLLQAKDADDATRKLRARFDLDELEARQVLSTTLSELISLMRNAADAHRDSAASTEEQFRTRNGRRVFGGGGISPDLVVEPEEIPTYVQELEQGREFFNFVVGYVSQDSLQADSLGYGSVDQKMLGAFEAYLDEREGSVPAGPEQQAIEDLRRIAEEKDWAGEVRTLIDSLEHSLETERAKAIHDPDTLPYVRAALERELANRVRGRKASLLIAIQRDRQVQAALEILQDQDRYNRVLAEGR